MKTGHKLFFAIPFDSITKNLYKRISINIQRRFRTVTTVIGNEQVGPSPRYADFASFKAQNRELTEQFKHQIMEADVVIADLTPNNPNVHVEPGIALTQNKNILRVSGRPASELTFDIRNLDLHHYENEIELEETITHYLETFFKIKELQISDEYGSLYSEEPNVPVELRESNISGSNKGWGVDIQSNCPKLLIRDGAVEVAFEILRARRLDDWFGIYFRAADSPFLGSHLAYVRQNGLIELAVYPGPRIIEKRDSRHTITGKHLLLIEFENNELELRMDNVSLLQTKNLSHQTAGLVLPAAYYSDVNIHSLQMICRDTIEWDSP